jgi:hypothetical protein
MRVEDSSHTFGVRHGGDVGPIEFGSYAPGILDRSVIALTSRMPLTGLACAWPSCCGVYRRCGSTIRAARLTLCGWGMRLRLHPIDNGCEKNLLFTPQMYETTELAALSEEISRVREQRHKFFFVDIRDADTCNPDRVER